MKLLSHGPEPCASADSAISANIIAALAAKNIITHFQRKSKSFFRIFTKNFESLKERNEKSGYALYRAFSVPFSSMPLPIPKTTFQSPFLCMNAPAKTEQRFLHTAQLRIWQLLSE